MNVVIMNNDNIPQLWGRIHYGDLPSSLANSDRPMRFRTLIKVAQVTGSFPPPCSQLDRMLWMMVVGDFGSDDIIDSVLEPVSSFNKCMPSHWYLAPILWTMLINFPDWAGKEVNICNFGLSERLMSGTSCETVEPVWGLETAVHRYDHSTNGAYN